MYHKIWSYGILFLKYVVWQIYMIVIFHFGLFFTLLPKSTVQKIKISKNEKNTWRYDHFTHVYQKLWLDYVRFPRNGSRRIDGRTKKWQIKVGAPPRKSRLRYIYNMNIKTWSHEHIQTWSSLYERVKIRKTAIKPAWLLIALVIELKQVRI